MGGGGDWAMWNHIRKEGGLIKITKFAKQQNTKKKMHCSDGNSIQILGER